jgi:hypothetical protein
VHITLRILTQKTEEQTAHLGGEAFVLCIGFSWQLLGDGRLSPSEQCNLTKQIFYLFLRKTLYLRMTAVLLGLMIIAEQRHN